MATKIAQLQKQLTDYTSSLFSEGILNQQFNQLQLVRDESNPDFVVEVVNLFFEESQRLLNEMTMTMSLGPVKVDYKILEAHVHQLKGSSSSIGAHRVQNTCNPFRNFIDQKNFEGCLQCLQQVRNEHSLLRSKMETLFKLEQQFLAAGGSIRNLFSGY